MRTGDVSKIVGAPVWTIIKLVQNRKIPVKKPNKHYFYTPENVEQIKKELVWFKKIKEEKEHFLNLFWDEIRDDNKREKVIRNYAIRFEISKPAATIAVNNYLLERSKQNYKQHKERIETREDGTVVIVLQSKINFEK